MKIVSHKVAKLAKEKGFDWKVIDHYKDNELIHNGVRYNFNDPEEQKLWTVELTSASSQYSLQNWLLTKHNIWVEPILNFVPDTIDDYGFRVCIYTHTDQWNNVKWETNKPCGKIYKSPWEALDVGLYEALKLIP